ncbi:hypothetical protein ACNKHS_19755 [Shigella flexneri]
MGDGNGRVGFGYGKRVKFQQLLRKRWKKPVAR